MEDFFADIEWSKVFVVLFVFVIARTVVAIESLLKQQNADTKAIRAVVRETYEAINLMRNALQNIDMKLKPKSEPDDPYS